MNGQDDNTRSAPIQIHVNEAYVGALSLKRPVIGDFGWVELVKNTHCTDGQNPSHIDKANQRKV